MADARGHAEAAVMATGYDPRVTKRAGRPAVRPDFVIEAADRVPAGRTLSPGLAATFAQNVKQLRAGLGAVPADAPEPSERRTRTDSAG